MKIEKIVKIVKTVMIVKIEKTVMIEKIENLDWDNNHYHQSHSFRDYRIRENQYNQTYIIKRDFFLHRECLGEPMRGD